MERLFQWTGRGRKRPEPKEIETPDRGEREKRYRVVLMAFTGSQTGILWLTRCRLVNLSPQVEELNDYQKSLLKDLKWKIRNSQLKRQKERREETK